MKIVFFTAFFIMASFAAQSQTLFTYGSKVVSKNEFVKAFYKNPSADTASRKVSLQNYLDLYTKYKLKVQAAYDEKLNETDEYKSEADNFKKELAETAINNEANLNSLVREAFTRSRKDLQLSQVFIPTPKTGDSSSAFTKSKEAYAALQAGKPFTEVAMQYAPDSAAKQSKGNIGWITVFTLPYEAENLVYSTLVGSYTKPFHSRIGYHIFKVTAERPALGKRKIDNLLFPLSPFATETEKVVAKQQAASVYQLLQKGGSFEDLKNQFGVKKANNQSTEVSVGQYDPQFETEVFSLQKEGDVSKPFYSAYGCNIIKLVGKTDVLKDTNDIVAKASLQEKVTADDRLTVARENLLNKWMIACGYKAFSYKQSDLWTFTDTAIRKGNASQFGTIGKNTTLFSYTKKKITANDWITYVQMKIGEGNKALYNQLMPQFIAYATTNYYKQNIEMYHPELKSQIDEFNDANLLFAAMDKHVWNKAAEDSVGLLQYYKAHQNKYTWLPGADAIIISANNKQAATELSEKIKESPANWRAIVASYGSFAQADSSRFENEQLPLPDTTSVQEGYESQPTSANDGNSFSFVYITHLHKDIEPRSFDDAKGMVINDYQQVIEEKWIADLKKKYPVTINQTVFNSIQ